MSSAVDNDIHGSEVQLHQNIMDKLGFMKLQISEKRYRTILESFMNAIKNFPAMLTRFFHQVCQCVRCLTHSRIT